jgi:alkanesulfonate monooxygenase SsuD/methylene tetrahydromethanopterin reductase-like flavin-dependent oxidoreductase (luciferase family)
LQGHTVKTAREQGWSTLSNGDLLRAAEEAGFDVLLTTDTSLPYQQNLEGRKLAVVILSKNRWSLVSPVLPQVVAVVNEAKPGSCTVVKIPAK